MPIAIPLPETETETKTEILSRQPTLRADENDINVRPVVKGAIQEASHTLKEAYASNEVLGWCARGTQHSKHDEFLYTLFKNTINNASLHSRDFAVQVDGCQGVLIWSNEPQGYSWPRIMGTIKLARLTGWASAHRAFMKFQPTCNKMRRRVIADDSREYITIGFIGVLPHQQRKGLGKALLQHVLIKADESHCPVYVEVPNPDSVPLFEHFGFVVCGSAGVSSMDLPIFSMVREPVLEQVAKPLRIRPGRSDSYQ
ncbi:hypothetical protein BDF14DRAFT_1786672 [Spinellus fusiger]|nr:hypothetical protein BDF14DRAFT_1786672 [Spinellus fusiger]